MKLIFANNTVNVVGAIDRFSLVDDALFNFQSMTADVTIDLNKVSSVDTAGVAFILKLVAHYQNAQLNVVLTHPPAQLIALAEISNVLGLLPLKE
ncbi:STAS domain-containing protein [Psychrosphaera aquimarina]|uniref:STAS domain-containing protein n=1 Tax=Psychrosphaera aquimarina TaxID=2044854 RepID=A0ABU3R2S8_9GAMM|nr:STAS domain-containing protein [Psychrosphaera aquimarina]MDU0113970.1 STAS domain-containing protein [Psychrosphaera aquimarina]